MKRYTPCKQRLQGVYLELRYLIKGELQIDLSLQAEHSCFLNKGAYERCAADDGCNAKHNVSGNGCCLTHEACKHCCCNDAYDCKLYKKALFHFNFLRSKCPI